jgi:hypothetical protein
MRRLYLPVLMTAALAAAPSPAYAAVSSLAHEPVVWFMSIGSLVASVALLIIALGLARVSQGSAIAENISYVVAACVCLAGSALAGWAVRFASEAVTVAQIELAGKALTVVSIVFFCIYFFRVQAALRRFLSAVSSQDDLARAHLSESADTQGPATGASARSESAEGDRADG